MLKILLITTIVAAAVSHATAKQYTKYDLSILPADVEARVVYLQQYGDRFDAAIRATLAEWSKPSYAGDATDIDLSMLPQDVPAQVTELQSYGDRFDATIRAIYVEALKPTWGFADCDLPASQSSLVRY
jgi:hypothetical protein